MTTLVPNASVQKLEKLLPQLHKDNRIAFINVRANEPVTGWVEGTGLELPLHPDVIFDSQEFEEITEWAKKEGVLADLKESHVVTPAVNLSGRLFGIWDVKDELIRIRPLDYRKLSSEALAELDFKPTSQQQAEERLNALSQELYGKKVAELDSEDRDDLYELINKVLFP